MSFEAYHALPEKWRTEAVIAAHRDLGGTFDLAGKPRAAMERGATSFRAIWYNLADGARAGDCACIALAVDFIEERHIVSYSGYARTRMAHALRHATLSAHQRERLSNHFLSLLERGDKTPEFSAYLKLWPCIITPKHRRRALEIVSFEVPASSFGKKVVAALSLDPATEPTPLRSVRPSREVGPQRLLASRRKP